MRDVPRICPCRYDGCSEWTFKTFKNGHATTCICPECKGRGSQRSGARSEVRRHKRLSSGRAPTDEYPWAYPLTVTTQDKAGAQVPAPFWKVLAGAFFSGAFKQAKDKIPVGAGVLPAVYVEDEDGRAFLVVDVTGRSWK